MRVLHTSLASRVAFVYVFIGAIWALLLHNLLAKIITNSAQLRIARTYEDWVFIVLSGLVLFLYLKREFKAREKSEQNYTHLFNHAVEGIFRSTLDGRFLTVNPAMARIYGYDSSDEMVKSVNDIKNQIYVNPELRTKFVETLLAHGYVEKFEAQAYRRDLSIIWISMNVNLVRDSKGSPLYIEGFVTDVTREKETEAALKEAETRYRSLVREIPAAVYTQDIGSNLNNTLYISPQIENISGYPTMRWMESREFWPSIIHPEDRNLYIQENDRTNQTRENFDIEYRIVAQNGDIVWVRDISRLAYDENQKPLFWQGVLLDITKQKDAEQAKLNEEKRFRAIIENITDAVSLMSEDGTILYQSSTIKRILGFPSEQRQGRNGFELVHPDDVAHIRTQYQKLVRNPENNVVTIARARHQNGEYRWLEVIGANRLDDPAIQAIVVNFRDITERVAAEEKLHRQLLELTALHAVATTVVESNNVDEIIERTTMIISRNLYPDNCGVMLLNPSRDSLLPHSSYQGVSIENQMESLPLTMGVTGKVALEGKPVRINEVSEESSYIEVTPGIHSELCVPIHVNGRIIGIFNVESMKPSAFDEEDERLLNTLAGTLGTAIERIRLFNTEQNRRQEAEKLREATFALNTTIEPDQLFEIILNTLVTLIPYTSASIEIIDGDSVYIAAERGLPKDHQFVGKRFAFRPGKWGIDIRKPIIIPDAQADKRFEKIEGTEYIHSWMGIPLLAQDKLIGYLNIDQAVLNFFTEQHAALVQTFANQAAIAIKNAQLYKSEQQRHHEAEKLRQAATIVASSLKLNDVLETLLLGLKDVVPYDSASVLLPEGEYVRIVAANGLPNLNQAINKLFPYSNRLLQQILANSQPLIVNNAQTDPRFERWAASEHVHGWMGVPMLARGRVIGFITLDSLNACAYDPNSASLALSFAHQAAVAIENARLFSSLEESNFELSQAYDSTLEGWGNAMELRDKETQGHTSRVADLTLELARRVGCSVEELIHIRRGALVHDIGKMGVPDYILHKKGRLTKLEWIEMRKHPQYAFDLIYPIAYLRPAIEVPYCHHERWDGTGYPRGLKGQQIPLAARIFAIVDVWDALSSDRPYRKRWPRKKVVKFINEQAGNQFDPAIVDIFLKMMSEKK